MKPIPCPFCGVIPEIRKSKNLFATHEEILLYWVICDNDKCFIDVISSFGSDSRNTAIKNWNFRLGKDRTPKEEK